MLGDVAHVVDDAHEPVGADQEAETAREGRELVVVRPGDTERLADRVIGVAEQTERELLVGGEREVLRDRVERRPEDDGTERIEVVDPVTQGLALDRSTRRGSLGVPPQQHPRAAQVGEADGLTVLVGQFERRRFVADVDGHVSGLLA